MSQQGPGGYGGGGPYGPPGGGGYGGGAPPGGGYPPGGAPPGGGYPPGGAPPGYGGPPAGAPPGAPPGYGPQPGYGGYPQGPAPGGPAAAPAKKSNALLFVGLGCGALVLLSIGGGVAFYLYAKSKVDAVESAITTAGGGAGALGSPAPANASAICAKAIACCKVVANKAASGNPALVAQGCNSFAMLADAQCEQQYKSMKTSAAAIGTSCE